jgi:hypothetical protein
MGYDDQMNERMTTSRILASYQNPKKRVILPNSVIRHGQGAAGVIIASALLLYLLPPVVRSTFVARRAVGG